MAGKSLELLTESMFYVLMALLGGEHCGTEITADVERRTGGRLKIGPGTLYTILAKFEEVGYIEETRVEGRKRTYQMTSRGRAAYRDELERLRQCVRDAEKEGF